MTAAFSELELSGSQPFPSYFWGLSINTSP